MPKNFLALLVAFLLPLLATTASARAQAAFTEPFDDLGPAVYSPTLPQPLLSRGWTFRNQSSPLGTRTYYSGILHSTNSIYFDPQSGAGYLAVDAGSTDRFGGTMSNWAILPAIANQRAGDTVTIWARCLINTPSLEIRYSPTGAIGTGSSVTDIGNFTQLLIDINPVPISGWTRYTAVVPGTGRLALRYRGTFEFGGFDPYIGIDNLSVGPPPVPPCNLPPLPNAGQTVTWTTAASPYRVCQNISIPVGGTVNVQPGVVVNFDSGMQLGVAGTLNVNATAASQALFTAPNIFPPFIVVTGGAVNASFTDFRQQFRISNGANIVLADCTFVSDGSNLSGGALITDDIPVPYPFVRLERCTFTGSNMNLANCLAVLRNNTFNNSYALLLRTLCDVTAPNTFIGQPLQINRQDSIQPLRVDGVTGNSITSGGGIALEGGPYLLGPGNHFQNNLYAIDLRGGLMRGSVLAPTGNQVNSINVHEAGFAGYGTWPSLGLPYRITEQHATLPGGNLTVDPGVTVESLPDFGILVRFTRRFIADGLPEAPITFRAVNPAQPWQGLAFNSNADSGPRLEYVNISGANIGVVSSDNYLAVDNSIFSNNRTGASTGSGNINFRKTQFLTNQIGANNHILLNSPTNPNSFENNAVAVESLLSVANDARNVWWNSAMGPRHPSNPGGNGELIGGQYPQNVQVLPFLTARPNFANTPPVVRMVEPGFRWDAARVNIDYLLEPGSKHILRWSARDDGSITSQRVILSGDGPYEERFTITIAANLPPNQRSLEFTVPSVGFAVTNLSQFIRVIAVDDTGQEAWDQTPCTIPSGRMSGNLTITNEADFAGRTFLPGDAIPDIHWSGSVNDFPTIEPFILLESDGDTLGAIALAGNVGQFFVKFPFVSTDTARLAIRARNNSNDVTWFFGSSYFSIRHDARMNFGLPSVQLTSPSPESSFRGGSIVPLAWTATAPEGIYSFDIQASYDAGRTWHLVGEELPASSRSYQWLLPPSAGNTIARVRIILRDLRFQNTSTGPANSFAITPGGLASLCGTADFNADGDVGTDQDIEAFFACLAGNCCPSCGTTDFNGDGDVGTDADIEAFFRVLAGGAC